ncbi:tetratricopeptide repeat protein [Dysgonomonas sp. 520]|uniref:tetratricopeptide repeat protein n=1 Tax=Dysgonomonas sp. 520 TaxID=2302931 RepID=UPI0013D3D5EA|nr:tetratricopeptide repeat protein [Dysgonomonas sp. 520]NDW08883.1 sel1 repeat family protein [Dysgonomonas sp. 520]
MKKVLLLCVIVFASLSIWGQESAIELYEKGANFFENDKVCDAVYWFEKSSEKGYPFASVMLGSISKDKKDISKAITLYKKSLEQAEKYEVPNEFYGIVEGYLGNCYCWELEDDEQAVYWYKRAVKNGNYDAMANLGGILSEGGDGIEKDGNTALYWLEKANEHKEELGFGYYESIVAVLIVQLKEEGYSSSKANIEK